jgi:Flp pilus assembly protein TadG
MVEMAFALPLMALILLSIIDLGLIVREYQLVQNAAREAARFSAQYENWIINSSDPAGTTTAIKQFAVRYAAQENITIDPNNVTINQDYSIPGNCGSEITITYPRPVLLLGAPFLRISTITLSGRSIFYNLYGC